MQGKNERKSSRTRKRTLDVRQEGGIRVHDGQRRERDLDAAQRALAHGAHAVDDALHARHGALDLGVARVRGLCLREDRTKTREMEEGG